MSNMENQIVEAEQNGIVEAQEEKIYTIVSISDDIYALDAKNVLEVLKFAELSHPERLPSHIAGLFEYDGKIINVADIKSVLNIEPTPYDLNSMIVIIKVQDDIFAIMVNKVIDVKRIDTSILQKIPYNTEHNFIESIFDYNAMQCNVLNLQSLGYWILNNRDTGEGKSGFDLIPKDEHSLAVLHKRKLEYIEKTNKNPYAILSDKDEFVSFSVCDNKYCIKMNDIRGFYKLQEIKMIKVPCTPEFILGLVNIKGDFICVVDVKSYFHSQHPHYNQTGTIIVLNSDEFKIGVLADTIGDNIQIKPDEILTLKKQESRNELMQYVKDGEIYLIINVPEMLANDKLYVR